MSNSSRQTRPFETVERDSGAHYPKDLLDLTDEDFESSWRLCGFGAFIIAREECSMTRTRSLSPTGVGVMPNALRALYLARPGSGGPC
jgi:hypothetical protein